MKTKNFIETNIDFDKGGLKIFYDARIAQYWQPYIVAPSASQIVNLSAKNIFVVHLYSRAVVRKSCSAPIR